MPEPCLPRSAVPYITLREGESDVSDRALAWRPSVFGLPRLAYADETGADRDLDGLLLSRMTQNLDRRRRGRLAGRPLWKAVHPARQREAMSELQCHYCQGEPSQTAEGILFLDVVGDGDRAKSTWPQGWVTTQPPLCLPHAKSALDRCKHLHRNGFTALRVRAPRRYGYLGTPYQLGAELRLQPVPGTGQMLIPAGHPHRDMFLAGQYAVALHGATEIDLHAELAAVGLT